DSLRMPDRLRNDLLKLEYAALRAEILQSISYQHQILLGGYGATGVYCGYILGKPVEYLPALIAVPFILLGMASLWIVECNRMVRASYYIGSILWPALRATIDASDDPHYSAAGWEGWIRTAPGAPAQFRLRQHHAQAVVVFRGPLVLSASAAAIAVYQSYFLHLHASQWEVWICYSLATLIALLWLRIGLDLRQISDLGASKFPPTPIDSAPKP
ncbi:MAG: hypothetical protein ABL994_20635, partial [Verrucomicrobiales bacterium]